MQFGEVILNVVFYCIAATMSPSNTVPSTNRNNTECKQPLMNENVNNSCTRHESFVSEVEEKRDNIRDGKGQSNTTDSSLHSPQSERNLIKVIPDIQRNQKHLIGLTNDGKIIDINFDRNTTNFINPDNTSYSSLHSLVNERDDFRPRKRDDQQKLFKQALKDLHDIDAQQALCDEW